MNMFFPDTPARRVIRIIRIIRSYGHTAWRCATRPRLPGIASSLHTEVGIPTSLSHRGRNYDFAFLPKNPSPGQRRRSRRSARLSSQYR